MQAILIEKLRSYIVQNNPDVMLRLQEDFSLTRYLEQKFQNVQPLLENLLAENKPQYIIEELCLNDLTKDLRPSKFNYIRSLLEEEFEQYFARMKEAGMLTYEIVNLINSCEPVFEALRFSEENENNGALQNAIQGTIQQYIEQATESASG
ncbi:DUF1896 family protein [Pontibacter sp. 172403-2]|uniref:DUF1896 family protein n=1 Tax=Pontibacter rufus TaxID=2791028 RepID=UPI0018B015B5|nr:DUF1896 family protein [Pontibacter sp. 172403-2]MBF9252138.1 DUF1896 family protein [Pontibacter sp. 172403-2]